nr:MAG TPA: hypothetical protein [Caudoviricetes sp.]
MLPSILFPTGCSHRKNIDNDPPTQPYGFQLCPSSCCFSVS